MLNIVIRLSITRSIPQGANRIDSNRPHSNEIKEILKKIPWQCHVSCYVIHDVVPGTFERNLAQLSHLLRHSSYGWRIITYELPTAYIFSIRFDYRSSRYILLCRKVPVMLVNWPGATRNHIQLFERERSSSCPLRGIRSSPKVRTTTIPKPTWHRFDDQQLCQSTTS